MRLAVCRLGVTASEAVYSYGLVSNVWRSVVLTFSVHEPFYPGYGSKSFLGKVGTHIPNYTVSRPIRIH